MAKSSSASRALTARNAPSPKKVKRRSGKVKMMDLLEHNLRDMYWAEKKLSVSMPKIMRHIESDELRETMTHHHAVTLKQITTLESIFRLLEVKPKGRRCAGIDGLIKECQDMVSSFDEPMRDPAIIGAVQKIEQYEIQAYTSLEALAKSLDMLRPAKLLRDLLKEEEKAASELQALTEFHVQRAYLWQVDFD